MVLSPARTPPPHYGNALCTQSPIPHLSTEVVDLQGHAVLEGHAGTKPPSYYCQAPTMGAASADPPPFRVLININRQMVTPRQTVEPWRTYAYGNNEVFCQLITRVIGAPDRASSHVTNRSLNWIPSAVLALPYLPSPHLCTTGHGLDQQLCVGYAVVERHGGWSEAEHPCHTAQREVSRSWQPLIYFGFTIVRGCGALARRVPANPLSPFLCAVPYSIRCESSPA